ncbi:MAG: primosomal protein N' [Clostridiales Family XIII bacterium]|jgi:primosomal protein N' (replication factor Y)|nr:primosomal protein N' [Clostridiales Family XIII bacterium]
MKYADVIVDAKSDKVDRPFTYACPFDEARVGSLLKVPFRGGRPRAAYVVALFDELPEELEGVQIIEAAELIASESIDEASVTLAAWMRRRYFCRYIEALACFAPAGSPSKQGRARRPEPIIDASAEVPPQLTDEQQAAFSRIGEALDAEGGVFLLHGVTGSGKTEIYLRTVAAAAEAGKQSLVLVPEISLTPQVIGRFTARFGEDKVAVLHSKLSAGERYDEWMRVKNGEATVCVGARSAVFAPAGALGAIIVDEEHETTYKSDMAPKYDTAEVAVKRACAAGAVCLLGSATPSVVSMYRAREGLYELLTLTERVGGAPVPELLVADMRHELAAGNKTIFSDILHTKIEQSLAAGKKTLLFLNRRGYSPFISCRACGYVMKCEDCGLSMSYHKSTNSAVCHFCGRRRPVPALCPNCGAHALKYFGTGTEKVEELTRAAFPEARIARLDLDTTAKKGSAARILKDFGKGKTDILIGTQMVAKGLDFAGVDPVGILAADVSLNIPDFRSAERTFQLITQAAGRAGRGAEDSLVVVQTYAPESYAIALAVKGDYEEFYATELLLRRSLSYPPFSDMYRVTCYAADREAARAGCAGLADEIVRNLGGGERHNLLGPQEAAIAKLAGDYRYCLYIKVAPGMRRRYEALLADLKRRNNTAEGAAYRMVVDVNPFSLV